MDFITFSGGGPKSQSLLRQSQTAEETKIVEVNKEDISKPASTAETNLPQSESVKSQPSFLQRQKSTLVDTPGNTPPAFSKNMVVLDIDIDKAETPKRPANPPSVNKKTSPCQKPGIPSKPKALPPKPLFKKSDSTTSLKTESNTGLRQKDLTLKQEETCKAKVCDKENLQEKNNLSPGPIGVRSNSDKCKSTSFGSVEKLKEHKTKKKKKSFSERFSMRKSNTSSSVFYSDMEDNPIDIGRLSKFYVSDELKSSSSSVNSDSAHKTVDAKRDKNQDGGLVKAHSFDSTDTCGDKKDSISAGNAEKVHELVRFSSVDGKEPALVSDSGEQERVATPEVHYYESIENNQENVNQSSHPKPPAPIDGDLNLECVYLRYE